MKRVTFSLLAATVLAAGATPAVAQDVETHAPAPTIAPQQVEVAPSSAPAAMPVRPYPVAPPYALPAAQPYGVAPGALPPMPPVGYAHWDGEAWPANCRQQHRKHKGGQACRPHPLHYEGGYGAAWGAYPYGYYGYGGYITVMVPVMVPSGYTYSAPIEHETRHVTEEVVEEKVMVPETKYVKTAPASKYVKSAPAAKYVEQRSTK